MLKFMLEYFCFTLGISLSWPAMLLWNPNWTHGKGKKNMYVNLEGVSCYILFSGGVDTSNSSPLNMRNWNQSQLLNSQYTPCVTTGQESFQHIQSQVPRKPYGKWRLSDLIMQSNVCIMYFCYLLGILYFIATLTKSKCIIWLILRIWSMAPLFRLFSLNINHNQDLLKRKREKRYMCICVCVCTQIKY